MPARSERPRPLGALLPGVAGAFGLLALLAGCEAIEEKYGPRESRLPDPIGESEGEAVRDAAAGGRFGPATATPRARDALTRPRIIPGTGRFSGGAALPRVAPDAQGDGVMLSFSDVDIRTVVDTVLGDTLGLNYLVDAQVDGRVTFRTSRAIPRGDVLSVLENILALNGAALVERDGVYTVLPASAVSALPRVVVTPRRFPQPSGIGTYVIPLRSASVEGMLELAQGQISPGSQLAVDRTRNLFIYTGPRQEAEALTELIGVLDVDVLAGKSFGLFPVQASDATVVATELEFLFAERLSDGGGGTLRLLPIARLNAILAIANNAQILRQVDVFVRELDRADVAAGRRVYVYHARNRQAVDLAEALNVAFLGAAGSEEDARGPDASPGGAPGLAPGREPVRISSPDGGAAGGGGLSESPGAGRPRASGTGDFGGSAGTGTGSGSGTGSGTGLGGGLQADRRGLADVLEGDGGFRIVAIDKNNALLIVATEEEHAQVELVLRQLDTPPLQVLIEATIAEVSLQDDLQYGIQWAFANGDISGNFASGTVGNFGLDPLSVVAPSFPGFNFVLDPTEARIVLSALSEISDIEVVSSPQLLVLDNQSARLQVGDQVPIATRSSVSVIDPDAPVVSSIEYFDTGVILEVTPRVNASGYVTLDILQEVSDAVETASSEIESPTIQQRSIRSIVSVQSGETIALGGLIRERATDGTAGVPVLQDIPVLGNLFKTTTRLADRTELLVLMTPRVIRDPAQAREVTAALRERLTNLAP